MFALTKQWLCSLLREDDVRMQEQALNLLRNLVCAAEEDGTNLLSEIDPHHLAVILSEVLNSKSEDVIHQAIYVIVNMATANSLYKDAIMFNHEILRFLLEFAVRILVTHSMCGFSVFLTITS
jgi:hypothetical protein